MLSMSEDLGLESCCSSKLDYNSARCTSLVFYSVLNMYIRAVNPPCDVYLQKLFCGHFKTPRGGSSISLLLDASSEADKEQKCTGFRGTEGGG